MHTHGRSLAIVVACLVSALARPLAAQDTAAQTPTPAETQPTTTPVVTPPQTTSEIELRSGAIADDAATPVVVETCAAQAERLARDAVVRVTSGGRWGAGTLVADAAHVVTPLRIVEQGHGIEVTDGAGNRREAHIVLTADADGLAMLELDAPLPGRPLPLAPWEIVQVGVPVVLVGVPGEDLPRGLPQSFRGTLPWAASEGMVAARGERGIQADLQVRTMRGSPIVTCAGELVAMLGDAHEIFGGGPTVHAMPAVPAIADLVSRLDHPEGYGGRWSFTGGLAVAATYEDPAWLWGASVQLGIVAVDAVLLAGRFSYFWANDQPTGSGVISTHEDRFRGDAYLAWRQILALGRFAMYFELGLGASVTRVRSESRRAEIVDTMGVSAVRWSESVAESWSVRPMAVLNLLHGPVMLSYTLEVDVDREHVVHVFTVGGRM